MPLRLSAHLRRTVTAVTGTAASLLLLVGAASLPAAHAQADITFSGGNGAPVSLTLNAPVTYTITALQTDVAPVFDFIGAGAFPVYNFASATSTITYSINGGPPLAITTINNNITAGEIAPADTYIFGILSSFALGDVVTLSAGTVTTAASFAGPVPAGGSFPTFLTDNVGTRISDFGVAGAVAAPEPTAVGFVLLTAFPLVGAVIRRRSSRPNAPSSKDASRFRSVQEEIRS